MSKIRQIDYKYYDWLVSQIHIPVEQTFNGLFERMHNTEFVWFIPNDDNRIGDAFDLRREFLNGRNHTLKLEGATLLEILVSLSRRAEFVDGGDDASKWAWKLLKNLKLTKKFDPLTPDDIDEIDNILFTLIWRTYRPNGQGGFFPLKHPDEDQTKVEIWYQLNKYIIERTA